MAEIDGALGKIRINNMYIFTSGIPAGCMGERYVPRRFVMDVPSYQQKVLVECLTGRDKGLWFVCSLSNFCTRYRMTEEVLDG